MIKHNTLFFIDFGLYLSACFKPVKNRSGKNKIVIIYKTNMLHLGHWGFVLKNTLKKQRQKI